MINYILKRCRIAFSEKKSWFLFSIIGIFLYFILLILIPSKCIITASLSFDLKDSNRVISMPERSVWRQINSLVGTENAFLIRYAMYLPADIKSGISESYKEPQNDSPDARGRRSRPKPQLALLNNLTMLANSVNRSYVFTYRGNDQSLGEELVNFYTARLIEHLFDSVHERMESSRVDKGIRPELMVKKKVGRGLAKIEKELIHEKTALSGHDIEVYKYILEQISTVQKKGPEVLSGFDYSPENIAMHFIISALISSLIAAFIIIISEFNSRHLTSEVQTARYLDTHIIGAIPRLKTIDRADAAIKGKRR